MTDDRPGGPGSTPLPQDAQWVSADAVPVYGQQGAARAGVAGRRRGPGAGRQADHRLFVRSGSRRPRPAGRQPSHAGPFWTMRVSALTV